MKTSIIQLETHDDVLTVRDRLNWVKGGQALLVWPKQAPGLERQVDLAIVGHYATSLGLQLGLVCGDAEVRARAEAAGIPVFKNLHQAQIGRWPRRLKRRPLRTDTAGSAHPRPNFDEIRQNMRLQPRNQKGQSLIRAILFTLAVLSPLAILILAAPKAEISLTPAKLEQSLNLELAARPGYTAQAGELTAYPVSVIVQGQGTRPANGTITVPVGFATGEAVFSNLTNAEIRIPAGSIVRTSGEPAIRFSTERSVNLAAGPGNQSATPITALEAGMAGNLAGGALTGLEGALSFQVGVSNPKPTHSGSEMDIPAPTPDDQDALYHQLLSSLQAQADAALQANLPPGDQLIGSAVLTETLSQAFMPEIGQPGEQISLTLQLQFDGWAVAGAQIESQAQLGLDGQLPPGYLPIPGSFVIETLTAPTLGAAGAFRWQITARRLLQAKIPLVEAGEAIRWLTPAAALDSLSALPLGAPPKLKLSPAWWPFVPWQVEVIVKESDDAHPVH